MEKKEDNQTLLAELEKLVRKDAVKTVLHGMTTLGLVEITRKKIRKPLYEQLMTTCTVCHGLGMVQRAKLLRTNMEETQNG